MLLAEALVLCISLVVSTSAINCLERLVSKITYYVSSGTLNPTHSLTLSHVCKRCAENKLEVLVVESTQNNRHSKKQLLVTISFLSDSHRCKSDRIAA